MFNVLKQGSILYILEKNNGPRLTIATVTKVKPPYKLATTSYMTNDMVIDIEAFGNNTTFSFKKVPAIASEYEEGDAYITDNKDTMYAKIEAEGTNSRNVLESRPYHESWVKFSEETLPKLNPTMQGGKEQEERLRKLEDGMAGIRDALTMIQEALTKKNKDK